MECNASIGITGQVLTRELLWGIYLQGKSFRLNTQPNYITLCLLQAAFMKILSKKVFHLKIVLHFNAANKGFSDNQRSNVSKIWKISN